MKNTTFLEHRFGFQYGKKTVVAVPDQIIRLEALSNYTRVYFIHHPPILMARVLKQYDKLLSPFGFMRIHRTHLVNPDYIDAVDNQMIRMKDDSHAEISRRKRKMVLSAFSQNNFHHPQPISAWEIKFYKKCLMC